MDAAAADARAGMADRFRGFLPVAIDVETGGLAPATDALLEIAAAPIEMDAAGDLRPAAAVRYAVRPFPGARIDPASLKLIGIDPQDPERGAVGEREALDGVFRVIRQAVRAHHCQRAVLLGHNAAFDLAVVNAACERAGVKRNPLHPFSVFDTVSLGALAYGQTVLARIAERAGLGWEDERAHRADYDALMTARAFCAVVNEWRRRGGPPAAG